MHTHALSFRCVVTWSLSFRVKLQGKQIGLFHRKTGDVFWSDVWLASLNQRERSAAAAQTQTLAREQENAGLFVPVAAKKQGVLQPLEISGCSRASGQCWDCFPIRAHLPVPAASVGSAASVCQCLHALGVSPTSPAPPARDLRFSNVSTSHIILKFFNLLQFCWVLEQVTPHASPLGRSLSFLSHFGTLRHQLHWCTETDDLGLVFLV